MFRLKKFQSFQDRFSTAAVFWFYTSLPQAIDSVVSLAFCPQIIVSSFLTLQKFRDASPLLLLHYLSVCLLGRFPYIPPGHLLLTFLSLHPSIFPSSSHLPLIQSPSTHSIQPPSPHSTRSPSPHSPIHFSPIPPIHLSLTHPSTFPSFHPVTFASFTHPPSPHSTQSPSPHSPMHFPLIPPVHLPLIPSGHLPLIHLSTFPQFHPSTFPSLTHPPSPHSTRSPSPHSPIYLSLIHI